MRILMISKACYVAAYRKKLVELGSLPDVDLTLVVPPYWKFGARNDTYEPGNDSGYRTVIMNPVLNGNHHLHFYPQLPGLIKELRPDIVHIDEEPYDLVTLLASGAARSANANALFFTWQNIDRPLPLPFERIRTIVHQRAGAAIGGNAESLEILRRRGFLGRLRLIPQFGVDPDDYPYREPTAGHQFRVAYAGRLWEGKGIDLAVRALAATTLDWRLQLLGVGPEEQPLRALAESLGVAGRVEFLGSRPSSQVASFLADQDVLVLPSRTTPNWKEQFGRILIESMACGVPVVGAESGEIPNVIGNAGLTFAEGDEAGLRRQLVRLAESVAERLQCSRRGRQRVLDHYTQRIVAKQTHDLYRELAGR